MAVSMGVLDVLVRANTRGFTASMSRATRGVTTFSRAVTAAALKLAPLIAGVSAIVGIQRQFSELDKMAKTARRMGLASESLMGLSHAADLAGVSSSQLISSMERMQRRIGSAGSKMDATAISLRRMGLSAEHLSRLPLDTVLLTIADRMSMVSSQTEKAALAYQIFGRSGLQMVQMLDDGAQGLLASMQEAKDLGIAWEESDLKLIEDANDAITRMRASAKGIFQLLAVRSAPYVEALAKAAKDFIAVPLRQHIESIVELAEKMAVKIANIFQRMAESATQGLVEIMVALDRVFEALAQMSTSRILKWLDPSFAESFGGAMMDARSAVYGLGLEIDKQRRKIGRQDWGAGFENIANSARDAADTFQKNVEEMRQQAAIGPSAANWERHFDEIEKMASDAESWFEKTRTPLELAQQDFAELLQLFNAGFIDANLFGRGIEHIRKSLGGAADEQERMNKAVGQFEQVRFARTAINDITARISAQDRMRSEHKERDPQLVEANSFLRGIFDNTRQLQAVAG